MQSPSPIRLFALFLVPLALAAQNPWKYESINNTVLATLPAQEQGAWALEFVSGRGAGDSVRISCASTGKLAAELKKPGDVFVFQRGRQWQLTFTPNFGKDGCAYQVRLRGNADCKAGGQERPWLLFKAEKPVDSLLSLSSKRRVTLTPDWNLPCSYPAQAYLGLGSGSAAASVDRLPGGF